MPGWGVGIDRVVVLTRAMSSASYVVGAAEPLHVLRFLG